MVFQRFLDDRNASVAPLLALSIVPIVGLIGASVDYGRASSARVTLQSLVDSTVLAIAQDAAKASPPLTQDQVNAKASEFVERARGGEGPAYLVCNTYRFHGHHAGDPLNYREKEEVERWRLQDPIEKAKRVAIDSGAMTEAEYADLEQRIEAQIEEAVEFAKNSPDPTVDQLMTDIYA